MATASELFEARHYPGVVALITDALEGEPECVPLLLVRARAHMALRRDLDAQADLRDIIRLDPQCSRAYRLLGQLAARRDENESAAIFFREALRLDPGDHEADTWLAIVQATARPAAVAKKLPAPAAAAGRFPLERDVPRFAKGTKSPDDERPTARFPGVRAPLPSSGAPQSIEPERSQRMVRPGPAQLRPVARIAPEIPTEREIEALPPPPEAPRQRVASGSSPLLSRYEAEDDDEGRTTRDRPAPTHHARELVAYQEPNGFARGSAQTVQRPSDDQPTLQGAQPVRRPFAQNPRPASEPKGARPASQPGAVRGAVPELPGFGEYLVSTGILTRERLRAAQAYQRSMRVQLATAIVTLGLATPQRIEWAAVAHQSQIGRG